MKQFKTLVLLGGAAILALSIGIATRMIVGEPDSTTAMVGGEADLTALFSTRFPDVNGKETSLAQWQGKVLVVNFWATWCAPCREEIPDFVRLQSEFGSKGVQFVGIAADQADKVTKFATEFRINYPLMIGNYAALDLAKRTGNRVEALPYTIVLDQRGKLVHRELGVLKPEKLREIFTKLL